MKPRQILELLQAVSAGTVTPVGGHGSHLIGDLAHSDALVVVPEDQSYVPRGQPVDVLRLDDEF